VSGVNAAVKDKFSSWEEGDPVVMARVDEEVEVPLYLLVGMFCLAIGLGMISCGECMGDAKFVI